MSDDRAAPVSVRQPNCGIFTTHPPHSMHSHLRCAGGLPEAASVSEPGREATPRAASVSPPPVPYDEHERICMDLMQQRDLAYETADLLAEKVAAGRWIGEHSSENNPWQNALDLPDAPAKGDPASRGGAS